VILYVESAEGIRPSQLHGFFEGWPNPPSAETHLALLRGSDRVIIAVDQEADRVVGFITAVTDGVLSAYIPFLEVLPAYRGRGIGSELARRMIERLEGLYMIDLLCDPAAQPFYARLGMRPAVGMMTRNYERQSGT
jgi:ribosomal protein S18 acetylase RimI-like enzyme